MKEKFTPLGLIFPDKSNKISPLLEIELVKK